MEVHYIALQYITLNCSTLHCITIQYNTIQYNRIQYNTRHCIQTDVHTLSCLHAYIRSVVSLLRGSSRLAALEFEICHVRGGAMAAESAHLPDSRQNETASFTCQASAPFDCSQRGSSRREQRILAHLDAFRPRHKNRALEVQGSSNNICQLRHSQRGPPCLPLRRVRHRGE